MRIERIDPGLSSVGALLEESDQYMAALYPAESNHLESVDDLCRPNVALFGCFVDGELAACGAVKVIDDGEGRYGEVKRLFVGAPYRRRGISAALMARLEQRLVEAGVGVARLEVGVSQPEALSLYRQLGYVERSRFGAYGPDPLSVFMEKKLPSRESAAAQRR
ncbi:N-acetyltransferase [Aquisalimonas sp. 2447]|uniref:GNAT family N-acetyltransferase n=1 Tax=Aquisalimonas sp. 2447 TaxID=2740807 RepID=UPI0020C496BE|nr:GNAT family N-acetyltransferase [Aquisalimonas sp. 2447]